MVQPSSPRRIRGTTWCDHVLGYSSILFIFVIRHIIYIAVFSAGIMVGWNLERNQDFPGTEMHRLQQVRSEQTAIDNHEDGWKTLEVFYGFTDYFESLLPTDKKFYSQARQDEVILSLLRNKTNGYFVDLAANDATTLSNSYALERFFGWRGLCIEPNPEYWYSLTHARKNCQLVGAVVGRKRLEQVNFKFDGLDHGGIVGNGFDNGSHLKRSSTKEYTVPLLEIFKKFDVPKVIDYLSLDVEGAEEFIMNEFPLAEYRIRILTIERPKQNLRTYLESYRYKQVLRLSRWGETLWIHEAFEAQMDMTHLEEFHGKKQYAEQKVRQQQLGSLTAKKE
mmetsp:Transcript_4314/g.10411  ORF Transcript_4314/g.10411 Transcript_4314/m.10411 type:complete len:336 (+) Transcript_4314:112-1119(+)